MTQEPAFLSMLPAGPRDRRLALAVVAASIVVFAAAAPYAKLPLTRSDAFIPIYQTGVTINDLITAVLLLGQFSILRSRALLILACGYLFTALMVVAHTMSFPGLFAPGGLLSSGPQTTAWLYMFWHGGFPLAVGAYALLKGRDSDRLAAGSQRKLLLAGVLMVVITVVAVVLLATVGHEWLPAMMQGNVMIPARQRIIISTVWLLSLTALLLLAWKRRPYSVLDIWLMVVCFVWLLEIALSGILNAARFDLGFYAGRAYGYLAASFVLLVLLLENGPLYAQLAESHAEVSTAKAALDAYARGLEGRVEETEQKYRLFMEQARDSILVLNTDGTIIEINHETEAVFDRPRANLLGAMLVDLIVPQELPDMRANYEKILTAPSHRIAVLPVTTRQGTIHLDIMSTRVQVGNDPRILVIARNVTEQTKLEQQLRQSQKMEAIGQLTGGLAHDFNNLLAIVVGNLDLLAERPHHDETDDELVKTALEAAIHGAELTKQLLAFSRKQPLQARRCDINTLVADMLKLLRRTLGEQIEINFNPATDLPRVMIDPSQFGSAIANMATNARDAMPSGGRLTFATQRSMLDEDYAAMNPEVVPGNYVLLIVTDTGTGISADNLARVFDPFFTTKPAGKGTGLGLSMVFGFVKQSGGHIKIYSEVGKGTVIRIYLPEMAESHDTVDNSSEPDGGRRNVAETIMIVDDNTSVRNVAVKQLVKLGYSVLEADTPTAALAHLRNGVKIDLLFTDIVMPGGMSGRELAQAATTLRPDLKVLFTSGFLGAAFPETTQLGPDEAFIGKPYRLQELAQKLRDILDPPH